MGTQAPRVLVEGGTLSLVHPELALHTRSVPEGPVVRYTQESPAASQLTGGLGP